MEVIFSKTSAADISKLNTLEQMSLLNDFKVTPKQIEEPNDERFGKITRDEKTIYRYRAGDYRIYFEIKDEKRVIISRVLHRNTLKDFFYRSNLVKNEDSQLQESPRFWELIGDDK